MAKGKKTGGRQKGSTNKNTQGKALLTKLVAEQAPKAKQMPGEFLLEVMQTLIPEDAEPAIQAATMHMKVEAGKALLPYFHYRKGEEREPPPLPPAKTGDAKEITYDAARRVLFALAVLERAQN
jgi:hypothetical protein